MRLILMSDTHNEHASLKVPEGDVLIHAGDFTVRGTPEEQEGFLDWFCALPHWRKVLISGNHDTYSATKEGFQDLLSRNIYYLLDSLVEIDGVTFYGTPHVPVQVGGKPGGPYWAFGHHRQSASLQRMREDIPEGVDVLITHSPPYGTLDTALGPSSAGCELLERRVAEVKPRVHVFGHIHEAYGVSGWYGDTISINASIDRRPEKTLNPAIKLDL